MTSSDILEELSTEDIQKLAELYEKHPDDLPNIHSFLQCCIKSRFLGMSSYVKVYSPRNCWREDGTFIASVPEHGHDIILHSLDPSGTNLLKGIRETQRFKFHNDPARVYTYFYAVHQHFFPKLYEIVTEEFKYELFSANKPYLWCLRKEDALKLDTTCPKDVFIKPLQHNHIKTVVEHWELTYPEAEQKLTNWLKLRQGFGVFLKEDNQLVSWITPSCFGQLAALQTLVEHRKKGYGTLVVKHMAKYLAEEGFDSCATINSENVASEALMKKLGFKKLFQCQYIAVFNKY